MTTEQVDILIIGAGPAGLAAAIAAKQPASPPPSTSRSLSTVSLRPNSFS